VQGMQQSNAGYEEVDAVRSQLASLEQGSLPGDAAAQAKTLDASLIKIGGAMPTGGGSPRRGAPDPNALQSFFDLNNTYNILVSMMQVGLDMAPTPTQISTWEKDCTDYNRTVADWKSAQQQVADFNAVLVKNQLQPLSLAPTKLSDASCSFKPALSTTGRGAH
jgi:hypothetical protein